MEFGCLPRKQKLVESQPIGCTSRVFKDFSLLDGARITGLVFGNFR